MSWDKFDGFFDYKYIEQLRDALWERILPVAGIKLPRTFVSGPDDWFYYTKIPWGSNHWLMIGAPKVNLNSDDPDHFEPSLLENHALNCWTTEYPLEFSKLNETLQIPPNARPQAFGIISSIYGKYIWKKGFSPDSEQRWDQKIFKWSGQFWIPNTSADVWNPTSIKKIRVPKQGDYTAQLWKRWLIIINRISSFYLFSVAGFPDHSPAGRNYRPFRTRPTEDDAQIGFQRGVFQDPSRFARIFNRDNFGKATRRYDLHNPPYTVQEGEPQTGDYVFPKLVEDLIDGLRKLKWTIEGASSKGTVQLVSYKVFDVSDQGNPLFETGGLSFPFDTSKGIYPNTGPYETPIREEHGPGSAGNVQYYNPSSELVIQAKWFVIGEYFFQTEVPIDHTYTVFIKYQGELNWVGAGGTVSGERFMNLPCPVQFSGISGGWFVASWNCIYLVATIGYATWNFTNA